MGDVPADEPESALEVERAHDLAAEHRRLEVRCVGVDGVDHQVRYFLAMRVPGAAVRELRGDVLAEEARDVLSLRRESVIERRGDQQLDDWPARPAE